VVRSVPVVLESGRGILPSGGVTRTGGQMLLVVLMVVAFATLVFARLTGPGPGNSPSPGASGLIAASASPGTTPAPTPTATPPPSTPTPPPSATPSPAPSPTATPIPSGTRRYTVKSGDTLSAIAARFGTTVAAISAANNITDPRLIRPGQVLIIP
jgi:LysM repeat protein